MLAQFGEELVDAVRDADARLDRDRAPAHRADLGAQRLGLVGAVVVVRSDVAAGRRELERDGPADAARRAADERDLVAECTWHGVGWVVRAGWVNAPHGLGAAGRDAHFTRAPGAAPRRHAPGERAGRAALRKLCTTPEQVCLRGCD